MAKRKKISTRALVNNPAFKDRPHLSGCLESHVPQEGEQTLQEQVWNDCEIYSGINASLLTLEFGRPSSPEGKKGYGQRVTYLFEQMEAIEAKYPFITNLLSKEWGNKLITKYRSKKYTRSTK